MFPRLYLNVLLAACPLLAGCSGSGPTRAEVTGTVIWNGTPVKEGAITFFPTEGTTGPEAGAAIKDGEFHIPRDKGPVVGKHKVVLRSFQKTGNRIPDTTGPPGSMTDEIANIFPPEYSVEEKTILIREVEATANTFRFELPLKDRGK